MLKNKLLLIEFEQYIEKKGFKLQKEVMLSKFIETKRKFRADYLITKDNKKIVVEINGGQWINGRHNRGGKGYENDLTKLNLLSFNNIQVFQFTYEMLKRKEYTLYF